MDIKHFLYKGFGMIGVRFSDLCASAKGQSNNYAIIQTAHRIEKGLTIENPRRLWGWNKVEQLICLIDAELKKSSPDLFAIHTGAAVIEAYIESKHNSGDREEYEKADRLLKDHESVFQIVEDCHAHGGGFRFKKTDICHAEDFDMLNNMLRSRHSCRDFADKHITHDDLEKAIQSALYCPSACNRQPFKVYAVDAHKRESELGFGNIYNADLYLIITTDINAFTRAEYGDWVVSGSIFAGYLTLALHSLGIGSCIMKKELLFGSEYNTAIRKYCGIKRNEKIIIEIATGYYKENCLYAYSNRKEPKDVLRYIE